MFITLHDKANEVIIKVEAIESFYRNEERVYGSVVVTPHNVFHIDESVDQIKKAIMSGAKEENHAVWEIAEISNAIKYRCSKCKNESYYPFDICPICQSKMEKTDTEFYIAEPIKGKLKTREVTGND